MPTWAYDYIISRSPMRAIPENKITPFSPWLTLNDKPIGIN